jgi:hypothetical protein
MTSKNLDLDLPEPIKISKNISKELDELEKKGETIANFKGYPIGVDIFFLYLLKKYKSKCVPYGKKQHNRDASLGVTIYLKPKFTKEEEEKIRLNFIEIAENLIKCIKNGLEIIIIPLQYESTFAHQTLLIYRKKTSVFEHFEPNGASINVGKRQDHAEKLIKFFTKVVNSEFKKQNIKEVTYIEASNVCPYIKGLQRLEANSILNTSKNEPGGYCAPWSMFFSELCLKNPQLSSAEVLEKIFNYLTTKESAQNYLRKVIRGYTGYVVETINTYLKIFFKPTYTMSDVIDIVNKINSKGYNSQAQIKFQTINSAIELLIELESNTLANVNYNLEADLKATKKEYKHLTKDMTKEELRKIRSDYLMSKNWDSKRINLKSKLITNLYFKKRILQNYEEYSNYGNISESVLEPDEELARDKIINLNILAKTIDQPKIITPPKKTRKRLSPNTKKETRKNIMNLLRPDKRVQEALDKLDKGMIIKVDI